MAKYTRKVVIADSTGKVSYKRSVVLSIVNLATKEINGVAGFNPYGFSTLKRLFSKKHHHGIKIDFEENNVTVDVYLNIFFGYSVNDVAFRVQENIKNSIESMTEYKVQTVNVNALGVVFDTNEGSLVV